MSNEIKSRELLVSVKQIIEQSRQNAACTINAEITLLYWKVGKRISVEIFKNQRAEYDKQIVNALSTQLVAEYGTGWSVKQLRHCLRTAETFY